MTQRQQRIERISTTMSELAEIFKSIQQQHQVAMATMMEQMEQRRLADREYFEKLLEAKGNIRSMLKKGWLLWLLSPLLFFFAFVSFVGSLLEHLLLASSDLARAS